MTEPALPASLRARVLDSVRREPMPPRAAGARRRAWQLAAGFGLSMAIAVAIGPHAVLRPRPYVVAITAAWLVVAVLATWAGAFRGSSMLGRSSLVKALVAVLVPLGFAATGLAAGRAWPETLHDGSGAFETGRCVLVTFALAVGPLVALAWTRHRSDTVAPAWSGAALGAVAASWAVVALLVLCDFAGPVHLLVGHLLPVVSLVFVGTVVGERLLAVRVRRG